MIPENIIVKPPTAELRENQKDQDSLPPYDLLDADPGAPGRTRGAGRRHRRRGLSTATRCCKVERLLYLAEYKRRQAAPGVKVTLKNFGRDRRYPNSAR